MKPGLIFIVAITILLIGLQVNKARGWGMEAKVIPEEFDIELKVLSGEDVAKLYPGVIDYKDNKFLPTKVYVFGRVIGDADRTAIIVIDIKCKQAPYLERKDLNIGWINPKKLYPIFFLVYLGEVLHNEDIHSFEFTYKIKKVFKK
ncbi:MAG: hypothetical protein Q8R31_00820 [Candidatus Omnitrophota bacterium]|nr:hypothetical protein [Candidatus Omnitrophota bacterium]